MKEEIYVEQTVPVPRPAFFGRLSWGAIFAGVFMTLVTALMLGLLGVAVGASTVDPLKEQQPFKGVGIGALVWLVLTGLISSFFGAWVAGRSAGAQRHGDGFIHGLVTWGVTTICMGLLTTTTLGTLLGGATSLFGQAASATAQAGSAAGGKAASAVDWDHLKQEIQSRFPQSRGFLAPTGQTNEQSQAEAQSPEKTPQVLAALTKMFAKGGADAAPAERDQAIEILVSQQGISREEASRMVTEWDQKYQQTKVQAQHKVREAGDVAARGVSRAALGSFVLLALCAVSAMAGGRVGEGSAFRHTRTVETT